MKRDWPSSRAWPIACLWVVIILASQVMLMAVPASATYTSVAPSSSSVGVASATAPSGASTAGWATPEPSLTPADATDTRPGCPVISPRTDPGTQRSAQRPANTDTT